MSPFFFRNVFAKLIDQSWRRIIRNKPLRELERDEVRRLRTCGQPVQQFQSLVFALGLDAVTEHELGSGLVHARIELEAAALVRLVDGPPGKYFGNLSDIALRVTAVHTQRVQLQQLAPIVFIQPARAFALIGDAADSGRPCGPYGCGGMPKACARVRPTLSQLSR